MKENFLKGFIEKYSEDEEVLLVEELEKLCEIHINNVLIKYILDSHNECKILGRWPLFECGDLANLRSDFDMCDYKRIFDELNNKFPNCMVIAGGVFTTTTTVSKDIDIFFYDTTLEIIEKIIEYFDDHYTECLYNNELKIFKSYCYRNKNAVTFRFIENVNFEPHFTYEYRRQKDFQFITKIHNSKDQIIGNFDLSPSMMMYDGKSYLTNMLGLYSYTAKRNIIDGTNLSNIFKFRCFKYSTRTFSLHVPSYIHDNMQIYDNCIGPFNAQDGYCTEYTNDQLIDIINSWAIENSSVLNIDYSIPVYAKNYKDLWNNYNYFLDESQIKLELESESESESESKTKEIINTIIKNKLNNKLNIEIVPRKDSLSISPLNILLNITSLSTDVINIIYDYSNFEFIYNPLKSYSVKRLEKFNYLFISYFQKRVFSSYKYDFRLNCFKNNKCIMEHYVNIYNKDTDFSNIGYQYYHANIDIYYDNNINSFCNQFMSLITLTPCFKS